MNKFNKTVARILNESTDEGYLLNTRDIHPTAVRDAILTLGENAYFYELQRIVEALDDKVATLEPSEQEDIERVVAGYTAIPTLPDLFEYLQAYARATEKMFEGRDLLKFVERFREKVQTFSEL